MRRLLETFCLEGGCLLHLSYHQDRINRSLGFSFPISVFVSAIEQHPTFSEAQEGLWRVSVTYTAEGVDMVRFIAYHYPEISALALVEITENFYSCKWADRSRFDEVKQRLPKGVEPLFILNGYPTDTSFTNILLEREGLLYTPSTYLLKGTKRSLLLDEQQIVEEEITSSQLPTFDRVHLINAMLSPYQLTIPIAALVV